MSTADKISRGRSDGVANSRRNRVMSLGTFSAIVTFVACMHLGFWALKNPNAVSASVEGRLPSVSYNRFAEKSSDDTLAGLPNHPIEATARYASKYRIGRLRG
jgi:hypothetical protein